MAVNRAVIHIDILAISGINQLVAVLHHAGAQRERLHQQEFRDGQLHLFALPQAGVFRLIQHQIAAPQHATGRGA